MQINRKKIIKNAALFVSSLIVILLLTLGVITSDYTKLKKYDVADKSPREMVLKSIASSVSGSSSQVSVQNDHEANLGDFVFNITNNKVLIADISIRYAPKPQSSSWLDGESERRKEILKKGVILRDATIDTMLGYSTANANNEVMREKIRANLNKHLLNSEVQEVYFKKFIIQ